MPAITVLGVQAQRPYGRSVDRHEPGLAELRLDDRQHRAYEIDVVPTQA
jgi:hypothetical protein